VRGPNRSITEEALEILAQGTQGVPRLLNQAAHQAFLLAHAGEAARSMSRPRWRALSLLGLEAGADSEATESIPVALVVVTRGRSRACWARAISRRNRMTIHLPTLIRLTSPD